MRPQPLEEHCCSTGRAASRRGVICLTVGEAGSRGGAKSREELVQLRHAEFADACEILNVSHAEALAYPDRELYRVPVTGPSADLVLRIRRIRPQVLITFGPDGGTGHTDHSMTSLFATLDLHWAARDDWFVEQLNADVAHTKSRSFTI